MNRVDGSQIMTRRVPFLVRVGLLFCLPSAICLGYAFAVTMADPLTYWDAFADNFATAALIGFILLIFLTLVSGPATFSQGHIGRTSFAGPSSGAALPRSEIRRSLRGEMPTGGRFQNQIAAAVAAIFMLALGLAVSYGL